MNSEIQQQPKSEWWRWPMVPIAAVVGGIAGSMLFGVLQWIGMKISGGYSEDGWMYRYILPALMSGAFGWLFVYISCAVAPRGKVITGTVMTTLLVALGVVNIVLVWFLDQYSVGESIQHTVRAVFASGAGIAAIAQVHDEQRK